MVLVASFPRQFFLVDFDSVSYVFFMFFLTLEMPRSGLDGLRVGLRGRTAVT
jgi:hypothetical protein